MATHPWMPMAKSPQTTSLELRPPHQKRWCSVMHRAAECRLEVGVFLLTRVSVVKT